MSTVSRKDDLAWNPGEGGWTREQMIEAVRRLREAHEKLDHRPDEGLRERKKRLTRDQISDIATWMFCERGFDAVRIAEIAEEVGVSEKTVYNYFPTKESLVLDRADELVEAVRAVLRDREPGVSPTDAIVTLIEHEISHYALIDAAAKPMMLEFGRLIERTPALRTAMREMMARLADAAAEELAHEAGVDPRDPEPQIAAKGLIALWDIHMGSRRRHILQGLSGTALLEAVLDDTRRAARIVATGLGEWAPSA